MEQGHFVGLDVSQAETSVCVVDRAGKVLWQGKCASTPEVMATMFSAERHMPRGSRSRRGRCRPGTTAA